MHTSALILAAGRGSRMGESTAARPKCLVPLAGRPLFDWQRAALHRAGVRNVTVARGYRASLLDGDFATVDNPRWDKTNMVGTLLCALPALGDAPCIVSYSDIVYHPDHVARLAACEADIAIAYDTAWRALWSLRFADPLEDAETFRQEDGRLLAIGDRPRSLDEVQGQFMGLLRFTRKGFATVTEYLGSLPGETVDRLDMTALLKRLLGEGVAVGALPVEGRWCECDSMADVAAYEQALKQDDTEQTRWLHDWRWKEEQD